MRTSRPVSAPTELIPSSDRPSSLNATGPLVSASSAEMVSSGRQSPAAVPRTMTTMPPSGCGAIPARMASSLSATQPTNPGFSTSLTSSPVVRLSRYTSCSCGLSRFSPTRISVGNFLSAAISSVCTLSNGVRSRRCMVSVSTSCSRQFSSPPVSCRYSRCWPSCAQANMRMPRSVSSVITRAAGQSTPSPPIGATQTFSTPSCGAIQASRVPSGDSCGLMRSGFPNRTRRGMSSAMGHAYHACRCPQYHRGVLRCLPVRCP